MILALFNTQIEKEKSCFYLYNYIDILCIQANHYSPHSMSVLISDTSATVWSHVLQVLCVSV